MNPQITVLMAVYNSEKYLREAIDSILAQTFTNFEFLIIDDGSTDSTLSIIESYKDHRIVLIKNVANIGLTKSLNAGLKNARGKYIARLDGDDVALPTRLEVQLKHMEAHPKTVLIGTWAECIDKNGTTFKTSRNPIDPVALKFDLTFENLFIHSSIFFNKKIILDEGGYNEDFRHSQDFELYSRLAQNYTLYNIPEILIKLRLHEESVVAKEATQKIVYTNALEIIKNNIGRYIPISDAEFDILLNAMILKKPWREGTFGKVHKASQILRKFYYAYIEKEKPNPVDLVKIYHRYKGRRNMLWKLYFINIYQKCFTR